MILPTKKLNPENSLIYVGGQVLSMLREPKTVSQLWHDINYGREQIGPVFTYDWFVLSLDLLFVLDAIELHEGKLYCRSK